MLTQAICAFSMRAVTLIDSFQVDYALEAVRKGTCAVRIPVNACILTQVGIRGKDVVVLGVE